MAQLLQDKSLATKFQILVEIAAGQPDIQQKDIARRLNVTPQAVSEYITKLVEDGWIISQGRSKYRITKEGVDWLLKALREMQSYFALVEKTAQNIAVCAAVADCDLSRGQTVGLVMRDGLLLATGFEENGAKGIAVSDAKEGKDVGVSNIEGILELQMGKVAILSVPDIQRGGSRSVDLTLLKNKVDESRLISVMGVEALIALRQVGFEPHFSYGVKEVIVEAAHCGLSPLVICTEDKISDLLQRLGEESLGYELLDLRKG